MRFKNVDTDTIVEVPIEDKGRIERFRGYPDKFVEIGELLSNKPKKDKEAEKEADNKPEKEEEKPVENEGKEAEKEEIDNKNEKKKN